MTCPSRRTGSHRSRVLRWLRPHPILVGLVALIWLIARTGRKPSRLAYPCQKAALGSASLVIGLPFAHAMLKMLAGLRARRSQVAILFAVVLALALGGFTGSDETAVNAKRAALLPPRDYRATIHVIEGAGGPQGDHHLGLDDLISCMGEGGLKFYRSPTVGPISGPDGIVGSADVVLVKINQQWPERGGTNTDVLKGLIARVVEHPDGFAGEVVVVENTQGAGTLDWTESNAEDHGQSALDVVNHFADLGWPVSAYLWDTIRTTSVQEYAGGDMQDGYVVGPYDEQTQIRVSYPKFVTAENHYVSLKHGLWDPQSQTYDDSLLTFLNVPVLKCHGAVYGVTACLKHHVGTMTTALYTSTHSAVRYGGLGSFLTEVRRPDLEILDCIYILARPNGGPWCTYEEATRVDKLVGGRDPVAIDIWATANILVPAIIANGYTSYPKQDPEDPGSIFRIYLDNTTNVLLEAGHEVTNDLADIDAHICSSLGVEPGASGAPPAMLAKAFPNPFSAGTAIRVETPLAGTVRLDIYDATGRRVRSFQETIGGAVRQILWDGKDAGGRLVPAGTYAWRLSGRDAVTSGTVTVLR